MRRIKQFLIIYQASRTILQLQRKKQAIYKKNDLIFDREGILVRRMNHKKRITFQKYSMRGCLMGCIQISVIRSNNISIDRARRGDPNARMADSDVGPLPRNRFLKFVPSSTNRNSMGRREGKIVPDSLPHA